MVEHPAGRTLEGPGIHSMNVVNITNVTENENDRETGNDTTGNERERADMKIDHREVTVGQLRQGRVPLDLDLLLVPVPPNQKRRSPTSHSLGCSQQKLTP
jgi:hypothetical protein